MTAITTIDLLDRLADLRAAVDMVRVKRQQAMDAAMPAEVAATLAEIDAEYGPMIEAAEKNAAELEEQIKAAVIAEGASVKSTWLHAVYTKGRVTWDGKKLDGMMALLPGLEAARKVGEPSVSIRKV